MATTLREEVTLNYYRTTAVRAHSATAEHYHFSANNLMRWLRGWLPTDKEAVCVDLACGCGEVLFLLEREGFARTTGVDMCKEEIQEAGNFVRGELVHQDILSFLEQRPADSIEFISALNILEHLDKESLYGVLKQAYRVLRKGGTLVAIVPNAVSPFGALTRHWDITHEQAFTTNSIRQLAALVGFDQHPEFRECRPVAHGVVSLCRALMWQCVRFLVATRFLIEVGTTKDGIYTMDMLVRLRKV
jgi:SAM-dependent methyltransferase